MIISYESFDTKPTSVIVIKVREMLQTLIILLLVSIFNTRILKMVIYTIQPKFMINQKGIQKIKKWNKFVVSMTNE